MIALEVLRKRSPNGVTLGKLLSWTSQLIIQKTTICLRNKVNLILAILLGHEAFRKYCIRLTNILLEQFYKVYILLIFVENTF